MHIPVLKGYVVLVTQDDDVCEAFFLSLLYVSMLASTAGSLQLPLPREAHFEPRSNTIAPVPLVFHLTWNSAEVQADAEAPVRVGVIEYFYEQGVRHWHAI